MGSHEQPAPAWRLSESSSVREQLWPCAAREFCPWAAGREQLWPRAALSVSSSWAAGREQLWPRAARSGSRLSGTTRVLPCSVPGRGANQTCQLVRSGNRVLEGIPSSVPDGVRIRLANWFVPETACSRPGISPRHGQRCRRTLRGPTVQQACPLGRLCGHWPGPCPWFGTRLEPPDPRALARP